MDPVEDRPADRFVEDHAIGKIWSDFGLRPHRVDHFKLSTDPLFIDKLYDIDGPI